MGEILRFSKDCEIVRKLCTADGQLDKLVDIIGELSLTLQENYFEALVRQMIGQQLSVKVATTIWRRVMSLCPRITPDGLFAIPEDEFRKAGVSGRKTDYIKGFSEKVMLDEIQLEELSCLTDQEVMDRLIKIKGIGLWTAEMFLIFSLGRLNVQSLGDVGLQRAYRWLYNLDKSEIVNKETVVLAQAFTRWDPYNTVASLFLWEAVNEGYVDYYHSLDDLIRQENRQ
ncbi:MAG TPA: DNA-3-methyladenine glycosylase 2 family protein [Bacillota bacterium]|nr:DNA-3-methyladenine glycosylase 2 family protein [Bacillota bacterium]